MLVGGFMREIAALRATDTNIRKFNPTTVTVWLLGIPLANIAFWGGLYKLTMWLLR